MPALMHKSLWLLIRLSVGARLRSLGKLTKSWKGRFVLLCIVGVIGLWLVGTLIGTGAGRFSPDTIRSLGALSLAVMLFATVVFGGNEGGVAFSPAEVEFLFPRADSATASADLSHRSCGAHRAADIDFYRLHFPKKHANADRCVAGNMVVVFVLVTCSNGMATHLRNCRAGNGCPKQEGDWRHCRRGSAGFFGYGCFGNAAVL